MRQKTEKWLGGRVYATAEGDRRWIIRKTVDGVSYNLTLEAESEEAALLEYRAFRANPAEYAAALRGEQERSDSVRLDEKAVGDFLKYLKAAGRSAGYVVTLRCYLAAWDEALRGRDLRYLDAKTTKRLLAAWEAGRKHRIIAFKSFCSWLVEKGELDPAESPGRFLTVPASRRTHEVKGYSIEAVEKLYARLPTQFLRDTLRLLASSGMHLSEINRLAKRDGTVRDLEGYGDIAGTITFKHKTGRLHIISLDAKALAAAKRMQERGKAPSSTAILEVVDRIRQKAGDNSLERIAFGAIRHSRSTWLAECGEEYHPAGKGLPVETIARSLGHTSARTTMLHYLSVQVPPMLRVPIRLEHPDDPPLEKSNG